MTLESVLGEECRLLEQTECVDLYEIGEVPCLYSPSEAGIQPIEPPRSHFDRPRRQTQRQALDKLVKRLQQKEFVGREHAEAYLRDQYRRGCRENTMRSTLAGVERFLTSITDTGRTCIEEIVREDVFKFIENEQDRGSKPRTVMTRLRSVKLIFNSSIFDSQ